MDHGSTLLDTFSPEIDLEIKKALEAAGRSWCGVPGCERCREELRALYWETMTTMKGSRHDK